MVEVLDLDVEIDGLFGPLRPGMRSSNYQSHQSLAGFWQAAAGLASALL
jgi:hypothetical protein